MFFNAISDHKQDHLTMRDSAARAQNAQTLDGSSRLSTLKVVMGKPEMKTQGVCHLVRKLPPAMTTATLQRQLPAHS